MIVIRKFFCKKAIISVLKNPFAELKMINFINLVNDNKMFQLNVKPLMVINFFYSQNCHNHHYNHYLRSLYHNLHR